jgi:hypothetical protein
MKTTPHDRANYFESIKYELEEVQEAFIWLVRAIPDGDWNRKLPGEVWTARAEIVHIVQALEVLPGGIERAIHGKGRSILSMIPPGLRSWINGYILIPLRSRHSTQKSVVEAYEAAFQKLVRILEDLPDEDWEKGTSYPHKYRTVAQMAHRPKEHFEEHAAHLCKKLNIRPVDSLESSE